MVYLILANGFEEIEAVTVTDVLRRAGIQVRTVSAMEAKSVFGAHEINITADNLLGECDFSRCAMMVIPGGMKGTENLCNHTDFKFVLKKYAAGGGKIAAICAAPLILAGADLIRGEKVTVYPGLENELQGASCVEETVVVSGNIITGRGPGASFDFALKIVEILKDKDTAEGVCKSLLLP